MPFPTSFHWARCGRALALALLAATLTAPSEGTVGRRGFTVAADGSVLLEGKPFRGIGANYVCGLLFNGGESVPNPEVVFPQLAARGIPFVRMMFVGYHPNDLPKTPAQREARYQIMDRIVNAAEANGIGLVVSFFFQFCSWADIHGEPVGAWANANSLTRTYARLMTDEVVTRYRGRRGIYGWEFGNEVNLFVDIPGGAYSYWPTFAFHGYPATRTVADETTNAGMREAIGEFAGRVRALDYYGRILSSGNSMPRPSAWNLRAGLGWGVDTYAQFKEMLEFQNPDMDVFSGHAYTDEVGSPYFDDLPRLAWLKQASNELGKPAAAFEWGVSGPSSTSTALFNQYLAQIEAQAFPLSAFWVFQYPLQPEWSITPDNDRSYQLVAIQSANQRMRATTPDATIPVGFTLYKGNVPSTLDVQVRNAGSSTNRLEVAMDFAPDGTATVRLPGRAAFDVSFKFRSFLRKTIAVDASTGNVTLGTQNLVNGDVNGDNVVNESDLVLVQNALSQSSGRPGRGQQWVDLNGDGRVTAEDVRIVRRSLGQTGDL